MKLRNYTLSTIAIVILMAAVHAHAGLEETTLYDFENGVVGWTSWAFGYHFTYNSGAADAHSGTNAMDFYFDQQVYASDNEMRYAALWNSTPPVTDWTDYSDVSFWFKTLHDSTNYIRIQITESSGEEWAQRLYTRITTNWQQTTVRLNPNEWMVVENPQDRKIDFSNIVTVKFNFDKTSIYFKYPRYINIFIDDVKLGKRTIRSDCDFNGDGKKDWSIFSPATGKFHIQYTEKVTAEFVVSTNMGSVEPFVNYPANTTAPWVFDNAVPVPADYDGDGTNDLALFDHGFSTWMIRDTGAQTTADFRTFASTETNNQVSIPLPADYDGDGTAELCAYGTANGDWVLRRCYEDTVIGDIIYTNEILNFEPGFATPVPKDYNGDGLVDIAGYIPNHGIWYIYTWTNLTAKTNFIPVNGVLSVETWGAMKNAMPVPADYDGDGKADLAVYGTKNGNWYIKQSSDDASVTINWGVADVGTPAPGDYDGDGKADLAIYHGPSGMWFIRKSSTGQMQVLVSGGINGVPIPFDHDSDGITDPAVFTEGNGQWYFVDSSTALNSSENWGANDGAPVCADYDGDGATDYALYRYASGYWYIQNSRDNSFDVIQWGNSASQPVPSDYDGDGKADLAVYSPSGNWSIYYMGTAIQEVINWGAPVTQPAPADFDGDKITDLAVFWPQGNKWFIRQSSTTTLKVVNSNPKGAAFPLPNDYDGDGKADVAVYDTQGYWYITKSSDGTTTTSFWGHPATTPVPADYDGDGSANLAVFLPKNGTWYILSNDSLFNTPHQWLGINLLPITSDAYMNTVR